MLPLLALAALQGGGSGPPPNVVVILMDDVGRDKVGFYGDHPHTPPTPNLDALVSQGVLFRNAWAYPVCSPTRAALLTGRRAERTGIGDIIRLADQVDTELPASEVTLPEAMPAHTSVAIGKWHLNDRLDTAAHALDAGFASFSGWNDQNAYFNWTENVNGVLTPRTGYFPLSNGEFALSYIEQLEDPFFVYYCPYLAHAFFHTPPANLHTQTGILTTNLQKQFAMVEALDTILGRIIASVDLETTYLFVLGDNGSPNSTVAPPFEPHKVKGTLYEGGVRVPMIAAGPGVARGAECAELVQVTDYFATILDLTGYAPAAQGAEDSVSFAHLLSDPSARGSRDFLYASRFGFPGSIVTLDTVRALRTKRWKIIDTNGGETVELYDLENDPLEKDNLLTSNPGPFTALLRDRMLAMMP